MQSGPYHHPALRMSGVWSLRVPDIFRLAFPADCLHWSDCHPEYELPRVPPDPQGSQHMAGCSPHRHRCGGQRIYLRTVRHVTTHSLGGGIDYPLCVSPRRPDCIIPAVFRVRRAVSEGSRPTSSLAFPADCLHLRIVTSISQHLYITGSAGYSGFPAYSRIF